MAFEDQLHRLARGGQGRVVQRALAVHGGVASRHQQCVALAQRDGQALAQAQHHVATGVGAAGLHEAHVPRGDVRLVGQLQLAQVPLLAPDAQVVPKTGGPRRCSAVRQRVARGAASFSSTNGC